MADLSDVEAALVGLIAPALFSASGSPYLSGAAQMSAAGVTCKLYRGWPESSRLDADLGATVPTAHVSVFPAPGVARDTTRNLATWQPMPSPPATLAWTVAGATATLTGTPSSGQSIGLRVGPGGMAPTYSYGLNSADTLATAVAALAALVPGATVSGATVTLPTATFDARIGTIANSALEIRRQRQHFLVSIWAPTPAARDAIASLVDAALAAATIFTMPDGWAAWLTYGGTRTDDRPQKVRVWRRDLTYVVEYATTQTMQSPTAMFPIMQMTGGNGASFTETV